MTTTKERLDEIYRQLSGFDPANDDAYWLCNRMIEIVNEMKTIQLEIDLIRRTAKASSNRAKVFAKRNVSQRS